MTTIADPAGATAVARIVVDQTMAMRLADVLGEMLDADETVTTISEAAGNQWAVEVHFRDAPHKNAIHDLVVQTAGAELAVKLTFERLAQRDWTAASLEGLKPVRAGRFVVHGKHDRARVALNCIGIEIEAALAFGTGHHGTTRGCLLALDRLLKAYRPARVLDIGAGSGVLAIAAARALRRRVLASDIDRQAVRTARDNARGNAACAAVEIIHAVGLANGRFRQRGPFDLVFANILLTPLKKLAAPMARVIAPNARVILSGLLPDQANAALAAYRAVGLKLERRLDLGGWSTLVLSRWGQNERAGKGGAGMTG